MTLEEKVHGAGQGSWPDAINRLNSVGAPIQVTMSSNSPLVPPDFVLLTNMRSALKPGVGFGFCLSSALAPPVVAAFGPTDQITTGTLAARVVAVPQLLAVTPVALLHT